MNEWLSLIVTIFIVILIIVVLLVTGYPCWHAVAFAFLIGIFLLLILFPWHFDGKEGSSHDPIFNYNAGFWVLAFIFILYLIFYIIFNVYYSRSDCQVKECNIQRSSVTTV